MISNFNSIISKVKSAYRNNRPDFCIKNFFKNELILKKLRDDGFIRGFSAVNKKTFKVFLSYTKNKTPSLTAAVSLTSMRKRNLVGYFNVNSILRDFNVLYANNPIQKLYSLKGKKVGYNKTSQGIFLLK